MLAIIATLKVKPGMEPEFEAVATELVAKVNALEPGCKLYTLSRGTVPQTYVFMERYVDQAALDAHRTTAHYKELGARMGAFLEDRPEVQRLTEL
jgi:quinol monooxygenase YgiN